MSMQQEFDNFLNVVLDDESMLDTLYHEFRGEVFVVDERGQRWVKKRKSLLENEDAINSIIEIIRMQGLNKISRITQLEENQIRGKLMTFECKLADLMFMYRKKWNIDKSKNSMIYDMVRNIVEDARYCAKDGNLLKTLRTTVQRAEYEDTTPKQQGLMNSARRQVPFG